jgi:hypothetical protein
MCQTKEVMEASKVRCSLRAACLIFSFIRYQNNSFLAKARFKTIIYNVVKFENSHQILFREYRPLCKDDAFDADNYEPALDVFHEKFH